MILTGPEILQAVRRGDITIDPFDPRRLSPNAYDWRLGDAIRVCRTELDAATPSELPEQVIPAEGLILLPDTLYLGVTHERTLSERYAQLINGDRTIGTLGVWVHVSAPLGHVGHAIRWTLEMRTIRPVRVYPRMTFGKLVFLRVHGEIESYQTMGRKYVGSDGIDVSRLHEEFQ